MNDRPSWSYGHDRLPGRRTITCEFPSGGISFMFDPNNPGTIEYRMRALAELLARTGRAADATWRCWP